MEFFVLVAAAGVFALTHLANGWVFQTFELSPHISWVYIPAFLRLLYVLVLGGVNGFIAIFLGGVLLSLSASEPAIVVLSNNVCSSLAPVLACLAFEHWRHRAVNLSSLQDLVQVTLVYCILNAVLHHLTWWIVDPSQWHAPLQVASMVMGDFFGCLIGVGLMKATIDRFGLPSGR